jgi:hypothetical protein
MKKRAILSIGMASAVLIGSFAMAGETGISTITEAVKVSLEESVMGVKYLADDFSDLNYDGWTSYFGKWSTDNGDIYVSNSPESLIINDQEVFSDFYMESTVISYNSYSPSKVGFVFRADNINKNNYKYDGYYVSTDLHNMKLEFGKFSKGKSVVIGTKVLPDNAKYGIFLGVQAIGDKFVFSINHEDFATFTDSTYKSGKIGLVSEMTQADFDRVFVYEIKDSVIPSKAEINALKYTKDNSKKGFLKVLEINEKLGPTDRLAINDQERIAFTNKLVEGVEGDYNKAQTIYKWVIENIYYDNDSYTRKKVLYYSPKDVYTEKFTSCNGYSNLLATMLNIQGIPTILVEGPTDYGKSYEYKGSHVWNEAYIEGRWVIMDSTWDSYNRYENSEFHPMNKMFLDYFDPSIEEFSKDHKINSYFIMTPK